MPRAGMLRAIQIFIVLQESFNPYRLSSCGMDVIVWHKHRKVTPCNGNDATEGDIND